MFLLSYRLWKQGILLGKQKTSIQLPLFSAERSWETHTVPSCSKRPPSKKTTTPNWNELFQINVKDAEVEIVSVRFGNGSRLDKKLKGPKFLGEIEFPLRGAVRDFDKPNYKYKWFPITGGKAKEDRTGEVLIYIEFIDTRQSQGPSDVQHKGHVGLSKDGGFEIRDIPPEWKPIFRNIGLRRQDLENNPDLANKVFDIMQNATPEQLAEMYKDKSSFVPQATQELQPTQDQTAHTPVVTTSTPAPPPPPVVKGPAAPPPPPSVNDGPAVLKPPPVQSDDTTSGSVFDQIKGRDFHLKPVAAAPKLEPLNTSTSLTATLLAAMQNHRKDIEGQDKVEDDDGWSD